MSAQTWVNLKDGVETIIPRELQYKAENGRQHGKEKWILYCEEGHEMLTEKRSSLPCWQPVTSYHVVEKARHLVSTSWKRSASLHSAHTLLCSELGRSSAVGGRKSESVAPTSTWCLGFCHRAAKAFQGCWVIVSWLDIIKFNVGYQLRLLRAMVFSRCSDWRLVDSKVRSRLSGEDGLQTGTSTSEGEVLWGELEGIKHGWSASKGARCIQPTENDTVFFF